MPGTVASEQRQRAVEFIREEPWRSRTICTPPVIDTFEVAECLATESDGTHAERRARRCASASAAAIVWPASISPSASTSAA